MTNPEKAKQSNYAFAMKMVKLSNSIAMKQAKLMLLSFVAGCFTTSLVWYVLCL